MNKNIEYYFFHKENFLDESYCENSIKELNRPGWKKHKRYFSRTDSLEAPSGKVTSRVVDHPAWHIEADDNEPELLDQDKYSKDIKKINAHIIQNLHSIILEYIQSFKFDWFEGWEGYSPIKFLRYFPGQILQTHCDHIHDLFDGERKGVPILSIIGLLNDDYEGGELIMFEDKKIDIKKGDLVIFPSNFLYPHKITPVTKGVRYSYTSWVW